MPTTCYSRPANKQFSAHTIPAAGPIPRTDRGEGQAGGRYSSMQWCSPPKSSLCLTSWGTIPTFLMIWLSSQLQCQSPALLSPEVSALLGGVDEDTEL